jgi:beta-glucosidase
MQVMRTLLQSHAAAYALIHDLDPDAHVGLSSHFVLFDPADSTSLLDRQAAAWQDTMFNKATLLALSRGRLPLRTRSLFIPGVKGTLDWIGMNYYYRRHVTFDLSRSNALFGRLVVPDGADVPIDGMGQIYARGIVRLARRLSSLGKPIYITENGVHDLTGDRRPRFLLTHVYQLWHAIQLNFPVRGYFHHTLVDCFEWDYGYSLRFGLIKKAPKGTKRIMRRGGKLYAEVCQANALDDEIMARYDPELADRIFQG